MNLSRSINQLATVHSARSLRDVLSLRSVARRSVCYLLSWAVLSTLMLAACKGKDSPNPAPEADSAASVSEPAPNGTTSAQIVEEKAEPQTTHSRFKEIPFHQMIEFGREKGVTPIYESEPYELPSWTKFTKRQEIFNKIVAGGTSKDSAFYCGILKSDLSVRCWGARQTVAPGNYVDIAAAGDSWCARSTKGKVRCSKRFSSAVVHGDFDSLAGGAGQFCGVNSGNVFCWGDAEKRLSAPTGLKAAYAVVGKGFACVADEQRTLRCFGDDPPPVPEPAIAVKDLAAGDDFVCALTPRQEAQCFARPGAKVGSLPTQALTAITAAGDRACGLRGGTATCSWGTTLSGVKRVAVSPGGACGLRANGKVICDTDVPLPYTPALKQGPVVVDEPHRERFREFLTGFEAAELPLAIGQDSRLRFGDRIAPKFLDFVSGTAAPADSLRYGTRVSTASVEIVTAYSPATQRVMLFTYSKDGMPMGNLFFAQQFTNRHDRGDYGEQKELTLGISREATLNEDLAISLKEVRAEEHHIYDPALPSEDPKALKKIFCSVQESEQSAHISPDGRIEGLKGKDTTIKVSHDLIGCGKAWPFPEFWTYQIPDEYSSNDDNSEPFLRPPSDG